MLVECPQCGTGELLEEDSFRGSSIQEVHCSKCEAVYIVRVPRSQKSAAGQPSHIEIQHSGVTTILEVKAKLPEGRKVALVAMKGPVKGQVFLIGKPEVTVGRVGVDVAIQDHLISGKHCTIEVRENHAIVRDLGSTNGIYVAGEAVKTARLEHLSEFRIGETTLIFTVTDASDLE